MPEPRTLDDLRAIADPAERGRAVGPYIDRAEQAIASARDIRRDAIRELLAQPGRRSQLTAIGREVGVSTSTVKAIRDTSATKGATP